MDDQILDKPRNAKAPTQNQGTPSRDKAARSGSPFPRGKSHKSFKKNMMAGILPLTNQENLVANLTIM